MKENGSLKNICKLVKSDKKYWIIFIGFILLLSFGQNISSARQGQDNSCASLIHNPRTEGYVLDRGQAAYTVSNFLSSKAGDYYRLRFEAQAKKSEIDNTDKIDSVKVSVNLLGPNGNRISIKEISFNQDGRKYPFELTFKTNGQYKDLEFTRTDDTELGQLTIGANVHLTRLNVQSDAELASLKQTETGELLSFESYPGVSFLGGQKIYDFYRTGDMLGQTFKAESAVILEAEFKLHFLGNGGAGQYHLSLHALDHDKIVSNELASFDFGTDMAEGKYQVDPTNEIYRFPLSSKLEVGKDYIIVMENVNVKVNYINHLQVFGFKSSQYGGGKAVKLNKDVVDKELGDLYFHVVYPEEFKSNLIYGATYEDIGGGVNLYQYENQANPMDVLAVDSYAEEIKFDKTEKAVMNKAADNNNIVYKFTFEKIPKSVYINANQIGGNYVASVLDYSFDQENWQKINSKESDNLPDFFEQTLNHNLAQTVYLRVSYKSDDVSYKANKYFGLKTLKVEAEINN